MYCTHLVLLNFQFHIMVKITVDVPEDLISWLDIVNYCDGYSYEEIILGSMYYASKIGYRLNEKFMNIMESKYGKK